MKEPLFYPEFDPGLNTHPTLWPRYTGLSTGGCLSRLESLWPECNKLAGLCSCMFVELLCLPMERESGRPARCVWLQGPSWPPMGWFIIRAALVDPQDHVGRKMRRMTLDGWEPAERMQRGTCATGMGMYTRGDPHTKTLQMGANILRPLSRLLFSLFFLRIFSPLHFWTGVCQQHSPLLPCQRGILAFRPVMCNSLANVWNFQKEHLHCRQKSSEILWERNKMKWISICNLTWLCFFHWIAQTPSLLRTRGGCSAVVGWSACLYVMQSFFYEAYQQTSCARPWHAIG